MAATVSRSMQTGQSSGVGGGTIPSALFIPADVPDWTKKQKRTDTPFLSRVGRGTPSKMPNPTRQWGWGSPDPISTLLDGAISTTTGPTTITVDTNAAMQVGDRLIVDSEEMLVRGFVGVTQAVVERAFAGTTGATHLDNATVIIMGPAVMEGADDPASPTTQGEIDSNYFQIMTFTWSLSQRAKVTPTYEYRSANRDQAELRKKMEDTAPLRLELTMLLASKYQGSATLPSAMGGLRQSSYITTRTNVSGALTELVFNNNAQVVHNLVGPSLMPKVLMASPFMMRAISSWYASKRWVELGTKKMNSGVIRTVETWFGDIELMPNYLMSTVAPDRAYLFNPDDIKLTPYASSTGWQTGLLATQGWYTKGYLRGDHTVTFENPDARLELYGLSVTASDYTGIA